MAALLWSEYEFIARGRTLFMLELIGRILFILEFIATGRIMLRL